MADPQEELSDGELLDLLYAEVDSDKTDDEKGREVIELLKKNRHC